MDAIAQVATNLPVARVATMAEFWLGKPVTALHIATYRHALRECSIGGKAQSFGRLLAKF